MDTALRERSGDLWHQICDASERVDQLHLERCALEELRDNLEVHERDLIRQLREARLEYDSLTEELDDKTRRAVEIQAQVEASRRETTIMERQVSLHAARLARLESEVETLLGELYAHRGEVASGQAVLKSARDSIARMERKLALGHRRHRSDS